MTDVNKVRSAQPYGAILWQIATDILDQAITSRMAKSQLSDKGERLIVIKEATLLRLLASLIVQILNLSYHHPPYAGRLRAGFARELNHESDHDTSRVNRQHAHDAASRLMRKYPLPEGRIDNA